MHRRPREDLLRLGRGHFFDIHAAAAEAINTTFSWAAIDQPAEIELALDSGTALDQHRVDGQSFRTGLMGHQTLTQLWPRPLPGLPPGS